jgi:UDP-N-acetylmuramoyl-tripeptide--D-alanyl-D-alanine ligase
LPNPRKLTNEERKKYINIRRSFNKPVIGITGNLGKTSTLEILTTIIQTRGKVLKSHQGLGTWAHNINLLDQLSSEYDYAIFEFDYQRGNHFGELLRLIKPNIGLVTNIGDAHLSYLGNMMKIAIEKSAVVKYLARDGVAVLNKDDELSSALSDYISTRNIIKYGLSQGSDLYATEIEFKGPNGINFLINDNKRISLPIYSIQDIYNVLAGVACAVNMNFSLDEIIKILESDFQLPKGRGRVIKIGDNYILDESYISTPRSLSKAARTLIGFKPYVDKLSLIVGDMVGAGVNTEEQHLNMGYFLSALPIDCLITVGEYSRFIAHGASLIKSDAKRVCTANNVDEILSILSDNISGRVAISVKGIGSASTHRIAKFLEEYEHSELTSSI